MEAMVMERPAEQTDVVARQLAPIAYTEQLELELGLTDAERRRLNSNAITQALNLGQYVTVDASNPKVCGPETAQLAMRARRNVTKPGF